MVLNISCSFYFFPSNTSNVQSGESRENMYIRRRETYSTYKKSFDFLILGANLAALGGNVF